MVATKPSPEFILANIDLLKNDFENWNRIKKLRNNDTEKLKALADFETKRKNLSLQFNEPMLKGKVWKELYDKYMLGK